MVTQTTPGRHKGDWLGNIQAAAVLIALVVAASFIVWLTDGAEKPLTCEDVCEQALAYAMELASDEGLLLGILATRDSTAEARVTTAAIERRAGFNQRGLGKMVDKALAMDCDCVPSIGEWKEYLGDGPP
jgi:hypothetical protein